MTTDTAVTRRHVCRCHKVHLDLGYTTTVDPHVVLSNHWRQAAGSRRGRTTVLTFSTLVQIRPTTPFDVDVLKCCDRTPVPFGAPVMQCITPVEQGWLVMYAYESAIRSSSVILVSRCHEFSFATSARYSRRGICDARHRGGCSFAITRHSHTQRGTVDRKALSHCCAIFIGDSLRRIRY